VKLANAWPRSLIAPLHEPILWRSHAKVTDRCNTSSMQTFTSEEEFRSAAPGAAAIHQHLFSNPECGGPWGFVRGGFDVRTFRTWAEFSRAVMATEGERDKLTIMAQRSEAGRWSIIHAVTGADSTRRLGPSA
jgi:hypothetical protein